MAKFTIEIPDEEVLKQLGDAAGFFNSTLHPTLRGRKRLPKELRAEIQEDLQNYIANDSDFFVEGINNDLYRDWISDKLDHD